MWNSLVIGLLLPLVGTMAGSAFVFMMNDEMSSLADSSLLNLRLAGKRLRHGFPGTRQFCIEVAERRQGCELPAGLEPSTQRRLLARRAVQVDWKYCEMIFCR